ncbi:hypothetical protein [Phenylobacterium sp.]|uniref:hypothetical protein n=1 Tax=Phenylobacterium sp. TaxID=1871053 RepID=UPI00121B13E2|nr:hypothetical protein [Phenylobacterium sp.]THD51426.1 MAG: hypothetical protein E8A12_21030 [Phenylobacterium sp.]
MKRLVLAGLAAALAFSAAAYAVQASAAEDSCLRPEWLRNHTVGDDHTLYFDYNGTATYRLTTSDNCLAAATSSDPIVLRNRTQGLFCKPIDWDVSVRGARCIVSSVTKLTPAEAAALPKGKRP